MALRLGPCTGSSGWEPYVTLADIVRRREMVFVNGTALDQALSYSELQAGRFYVDENAQTLYIQPTGNIPISGAAVEVAVRRSFSMHPGK